MTNADLLYYGLQVSLFANGCFIGWSLRKVALTRPGAVASLTLAAWVAALALLAFAPRHDGDGYRLCTVASRLLMGVSVVLPVALSRLLRRKPSGVA